MKRGAEFKLDEVKALISKGKEEGLLTTEEIGEALAEVDLNKEQIESIYDVLQNLGIEIVSEEDEDIDTVSPASKEVDSLKKSWT